MPGPTAAGSTDSPATLLGPTALALGAYSALSILGQPVIYELVPPLAFLTPFAVIAGALAMVLGAAGILYARRGVGRMGVAVAGTLLGTIGFTTVVVFLFLLVSAY
ncbi:hypothetical protein [Streptomyces yaizuensis]|uniref:DUF4190 domain-containing protein n=1 Tax=Streptomyces yaizuensis TaxID=2989713 RepID=A0ABQ5P941_9ACTN|nr:hypothetical protein [Streptomyces sp. YSPA8]GLF99097.1 hypothetical protein SYYSPA8_32390 [Streptomyces sp. YSPA8]